MRDAEPLEVDEEACECVRDNFTRPIELMPEPDLKIMLIGRIVTGWVAHRGIPSESSIQLVMPLTNKGDTGDNMIFANYMTRERDQVDTWYAAGIPEYVAGHVVSIASLQRTGSCNPGICTKYPVMASNLPRIDLSSWSIQRYDPADVEKLRMMWNDCWFNDGLPFPLARVRRNSECGVVAVTPAGEWLGACVGRRDGEAVFHCGAFLVREQARRRGIGRALALAWIKSLPEGTRTVSLRVDWSNECVIRLYQRLGFEVVRQLDNFYCEGSHALWMELSLSP